MRKQIIYKELEFKQTIDEYGVVRSKTGAVLVIKNYKRGKTAVVNIFRKKKQYRIPVVNLVISNFRPDIKGNYSFLDGNYMNTAAANLVDEGLTKKQKIKADIAKNGSLSEIARKYGCKRQYIHQLKKEM